MGPVAALATARPHVLVLGMPGATLLRTRAESEVRRRGWPLSAEPEHADLLVVCGAPTRLSSEAAERLWERMAGPRARRDIVRAAEVAAAFDGVVPELAGARRRRPTVAQPSGERSGIAMFGPLAACWPSGVGVSARLVAGRITEARLRLEAVRAERDVLDAEGAEAVRMLDRTSAVLRLAGWPAAALVADRLVDEVLRDRSRTPLLRGARRLHRRVERSSVLALAIRPEVRDGLLAALQHAERALFGIPAAAEPTDPARFAATLIGRTPVEAAQWAASAGRPAAQRGEDG